MRKTANRSNDYSQSKVGNSQARCRFKVHLYCVAVVMVTWQVRPVEAGSRMIEPPTRASLWRYGFDSTINIYDDEIMCGGFDRQYGRNDGQCGVCGDPWDEAPPRKHEAGNASTPSPYPVRVYRMGEDIPVAVESSAGLVGHYEFRLCRLNFSADTPDQSCFDRTLLLIREAEMGQSYLIGQSGGLVFLHLILPPELVCSHCILQWRHVTGNRASKQSCVGCGQQTWYQGCADIAVYDTMGSHPVVQGARTQQEVKQRWEQTLKDLKQNCSCAASDSKLSDNSINATFPFSASDLSLSESSTVTEIHPNFTSQPNSLSNSPSQSNPIESGVNGYTTVDKLSSSQPNPIESGINGYTTVDKQSSSQPNPIESGVNGYTTVTAIVSTTAQVGRVTPSLILHSWSQSTRSSQHHSLLSPATASRTTLQPDTGLKPAIPAPSQNAKDVDNWLGIHDPPVFNAGPLAGRDRLQVGWSPTSDRQGWNQSPPSGSATCYLPYQPPPYLFDARQWCMRNCPQSGAVCNYQICRPEWCPLQQQQQESERSTASAGMSWLWPLLLMEL